MDFHVACNSIPEFYRPWIDAYSLDKSPKKSIRFGNYLLYPIEKCKFYFSSLNYRVKFGKIGCAQWNQ